MGRKLWRVAPIDKALAAQTAETLGIDPFAALLLSSHGMTNEADVRAFLSDDAALCDPFSIKDMDKAVAAIKHALSHNEKIAVFGDYDADGVTAASMLYLYLEMLGADVVCYIPDRNSEGYGLNKQAIEMLADDGVQLIVTVDNGISAIEEAEWIYARGIKLVVTDHHKAGSVLPRAQAIVDPHRPDCPSSFKDWAGVGVVFKLICALSDGDNENILDAFSDLYAVGTIADVVPLTGENRTIVKHGLRKINEDNNLGLSCLKRETQTGPKPLNASAVTYSLVPRINAIGRISRADKAFELLISDNEQTARTLAKEISDCNAVRQTLEQQIMREAEKQLAEEPDMQFDRVLVFNGEGWHGGVIGIVAARFAERFGKPCIVIASDGEEAKGSGRSLEGFSLYDAIDSVSDMLTRFGGHPLAAGFGIKTKDIPLFRTRINQYAKLVEMPFPKVELSCKLRPGFISAELLPVIRMLEPFGAGNPQPVFGLYDMTLQTIQSIGNGKHVRLTLSRDDCTIQALRFGVTAQAFPYVPGDRLDLAVRLEENEYMGVQRVSIYIKDIRMAKTDDETFLRAVRLYEKVRRGESVSTEECALCLPDRACIAQVFRYIRDHIYYEDNADVLCYRLQDDGGKAGKVLMSVAVLEELGVLQREKDGRLVVCSDKKVELESSLLLRQLKAQTIS